MRRVSGDEVLLTEEERRCQERFEYLRMRHSDAFASMLALNEMRLIPGQYPTDEFIEYLSDGKCSRWGRRIRITPPMENGDEQEVRGLLIVLFAFAIAGVVTWMVLAKARDRDERRHMGGHRLVEAERLINEIEKRSREMANLGDPFAATILDDITTYKSKELE